MELPNLDLTDFNTWWPLLLFCFLVFVITYVVRRVGEAVYPKLKVNHWWVELVMPTIPVILGVLSAILIKDFPFPIHEPSVGMRVVLGTVGGFLSSYSFKFVRAVIKAKTGYDIEETKTVTASAVVSTTTTTTSKQVETPPAPPPPTE